MSLPLSLSLFSPCSESQSASDPTAAPPPMACLAGYLGRDTCRIRTAAWEARGPAADWSFVRLTGFRSSIRVMELWGVQSCIGACLLAVFLARSRARAGAARSCKPQPVSQNPKSPVKPIAKRTTTEPARQGRGAEGKKMSQTAQAAQPNTHHARKPVNDIKTSCFKAIHPAREPC